MWAVAWAVTWVVTWAVTCALGSETDLCCTLYRLYLRADIVSPLCYCASYLLQYTTQPYAGSMRMRMRACYCTTNSFVDLCVCVFRCSYIKTRHPLTRQDTAYTCETSHR